MSVKLVSAVFEQFWAAPNKGCGQDGAPAAQLGRTVLTSVQVGADLPVVEDKSRCVVVGVRFSRLMREVSARPVIRLPVIPSPSALGMEWYDERYAGSIK